MAQSKQLTAKIHKGNLNFEAPNSEHCQQQNISKLSAKKRPRLEIPLTLENIEKSKMKIGGKNLVPPKSQETIDSMANSAIPEKLLLQKSYTKHLRNEIKAETKSSEKPDIMESVKLQKKNESRFEKTQRISNYQFCTFGKGWWKRKKIVRKNILNSGNFKQKWIISQFFIFSTKLWF